MQLIAYLAFDGNCEEALRYYEHHLGARIIVMMKYANTPAAASTPAPMLDKIIHAQLKIGDNTIMAGDAPEEQYQEPQGITINLMLDDAVEGARIFKALARDGKVVIPYSETFWARGYGTTTDQFGIPWMINAGRKSY